MKIAFRPAAASDLRSAVEYYDDAKPGLGDDLIDSIEVLRIVHSARHPESWRG